MPQRNSNFNELIEYVINAATEIFGGKYPTNEQLLTLFLNMSSSQVIDDDFLSWEGREFHWDLCRWFDNFATLVTKKNGDNLFQNMIHDMQMAFKSKEISFDPSSYLAMGLFLLYTSPEFREVLRDASIFVEILLTDPRVVSLQMFKTFPRTPESYNENYVGKKGKKTEFAPRSRQSSKTALNDEKTVVETSNPGAAPVEEIELISSSKNTEEPIAIKADYSTLSSVKRRKSEGSEQLEVLDKAEQQKPDKNTPSSGSMPHSDDGKQPTIELHQENSSLPKHKLYEIPIDASSYYEDSLPQQLLPQEKSLCSFLTAIMTKLAQNNQTSVYVDKILATCKSVIQFYKTGVIITPTPYLNSVKAIFEKLMQNSAEYAPLAELVKMLNFFDDKLKTDFEFQEICTIWIDYLDDIATKDDYRNSDRGIYRGAMLIQTLQGHLYGKYPKQTENLREEIVQFLNRLLEDEEVNEFVRSSKKLNKQLESTYRFQKLVEDLLLVVIPRTAVQFNNIRISTFAKTVHKRWSLLVFHFNLPTASIVPKRIDISYANLYQIGIRDLNSKIGRRCKIKLTGIYPKIQQVNYAFRNLKNLRSIDIGIANIVMRNGMDVTLDFEMDYSKPTPFKLFAVKVTIPKFKIESVKTKAPFSMFLFRGYLQSIFKRELIKSLENWFLSTIVMVEDLVGLFRVNMLKWENTFQDEIFNARGRALSDLVTSELYQFMCNISRMDTSTEEERRFQISLDESGGEPSYITENGFESEIPWTSHKFDL